MLQQINNNISFSGYSIIRIPKKAFKQPENYIQADRVFEKIFDKSIKEPGKISKSLGAKPKYIYFLEQPNYPDLMTELQKSGNYSQEWLNLHTGFETKPPQKEGFHSFIVLTKEDMSVYDLFKNCADEMISNISVIVKEIYAKGRRFDRLTKEALLNSNMQDVFEKSIKTAPEIYELETLDELPGIAKKLAG